MIQLKEKKNLNSMSRIEKINSSVPPIYLLGDLEKEIFKYALRNTETYQNFYNTISLELIDYFIKHYPSIQIKCYGRIKSIESYINKHNGNQRTDDDVFCPVEDQEAMTLIFDLKDYLPDTPIEEQRQFIYRICSSFFEDPQNAEKYAFVLHDNEIISKANGYNSQHITIYSSNLAYSFLEIHFQVLEDYITAEYGTAAHHRRDDKSRKPIIEPLLHVNPKNKSYKNTIKNVLRSIPQYKVNEYSHQSDVGRNRLLSGVENCYKYFHSILEAPTLSKEEFCLLSVEDKQAYLENEEYKRALFSLIDEIAKQETLQLQTSESDSER